MALGSGNIQIDVGARGLEDDIVSQVNAAQRKIQPINLKLNEKGFRQPLGRITGDLSEFQNSLDASVARTLAFGAAVGVINSVATAFKGLINASTEVEKKLTDVNVVLNLNAQSLRNFSSSLFQVAKDTGTSFDTVSDAAVELARQGLGAEETLKRIKDAMILTRLSGMDAAKSVQTLTAAINGFGSAALTTTEIVNKLATVDAAFAVSTDDLANALSRAGATAQAAKVSLDELLGAVTSVQQATARGGAVIGNAFKSIFTRIQRSSVREQLESIGVATTDAAGNIRNALAILQDYAQVYKGLSDGQRAYTDELVAGVFQINNLRALVKDLGSDFSIYGRAVEQSSKATDEAARRNAALDKTLSALISKSIANVKDLASSLGGLVASPAVQNILNIFNSISEALTKALDPEKGSKLIKGLFGGIGKFLAGPGLLLIGAGFIKIFKFITGQTAKAIGEVFKIKSATNAVADTEAKITYILQQNRDLYKAITSETVSHADKEKLLLNIIKQENAALAQQEAMINRLAKSKNVASAVGGAARGFIPSFAKNVQGAMMAERDAVSQGVGGASKSARPKVLKNFPTGGGKKETFVANTDEVIVPNFKGGSGSAILNPDMIKAMGGPPANARPVAGGFIPNFIFGGSSSDSLTSFMSPSSVSERSIPSLQEGRQISLSKEVSRYPSLKNKGKADPFDVFTAAIQAEHQGATRNQFRARAENIFGDGSFDKDFIKDVTTGLIKLDPTDRAIERYKSAAENIKLLKQFEKEPDKKKAQAKKKYKSLITNGKVPSFQDLKNNQVNGIQGIIGEIDAAASAGTTLSGNDAFFDLANGSEVKTVKEIAAGEILKKGINEYLQNNNIAQNEKDKINLGLKRVILPSDSKLTGKSNVAGGFIPNFSLFSEPLPGDLQGKDLEYGFKGEGATLNLRNFFPKKAGASAIGNLFKQVDAMAKAGTPYGKIETGEIVGPRIPKMMVTAKRILDKKRAAGLDQPLMDISGFIEPFDVIQTLGRNQRGYEAEKRYVEKKGGQFKPSQPGTGISKKSMASRYVPKEEEVLLKSLRELGLPVDNSRSGGFKEFDRFYLKNLPLFQGGFAEGFIPSFQDGSKLGGFGEYSDIYDKETYDGRSLDIGYLSSEATSGSQVFRNLLKQINGAALQGKPYTEIQAGSVIGPRIPSVLIKAKRILDRQRASGKNIPFMKVDGLLSPPARLVGKLASKKRDQQREGLRGASRAEYKTGEEKELIESLKALGVDPKSEQLVDLQNIPMLQNFAEGFTPNFVGPRKKGTTKRGGAGAQTKDSILDSEPFRNAINEYGSKTLDVDVANQLGGFGMVSVKGSSGSLNKSTKINPFAKGRLNGATFIDDLVGNKLDKKQKGAVLGRISKLGTGALGVKFNNIGGSTFSELNGAKASDFEGAKGSLAPILGPYIADATAQVSKQIYSRLFGDEVKATNLVDSVKSEVNPNQIVDTDVEGKVFEAAIRLGSSASAKTFGTNSSQGVWDFEESSNITPDLKKTFFDKVGYGQILRADAKRIGSPTTETEVIDKAYRSDVFQNSLMDIHKQQYAPLAKAAIAGASSLAGKKNKSSGFIPNFADALEGAIVREKEALESQGSKAGIYVDQDNRVKAPQNPLGLLVANTRDEPRSGSQGVDRAIKGGMNPRNMGKAEGFIPSFANPPRIDGKALFEAGEKLGREIGKQIEAIKGQREAGKVQREAAKVQREAAKAQREAAKAEKEAAKIEREASNAQKEAAREQKEAAKIEREAARSKSSGGSGGGAVGAATENDTKAKEKNAKATEKSAKSTGKLGKGLSKVGGLFSKIQDNFGKWSYRLFIVESAITSINGVLEQFGMSLPTLADGVEFAMDQINGVNRTLVDQAEKTAEALKEDVAQMGRAAEAADKFSESASKLNASLESGDIEGASKQFVTLLDSLENAQGLDDTKVKAVIDSLGDTEKFKKASEDLKASAEAGKAFSEASQDLSTLVGEIAELGDDSIDVAAKISESSSQLQGISSKLAKSLDSDELQEASAALQGITINSSNAALALAKMGPAFDKLDSETKQQIALQPELAKAFAKNLKAQIKNRAALENLSKEFERLSIPAGSLTTRMNDFTRAMTDAAKATSIATDILGENAKANAQIESIRLQSQKTFTEKDIATGEAEVAKAEINFDAGNQIAKVLRDAIPDQLSGDFTSGVLQADTEDGGKTNQVIADVMSKVEAGTFGTKDAVMALDESLKTSAGKDKEALEKVRDELFDINANATKERSKIDNDLKIQIAKLDAIRSGIMRNNLVGVDTLNALSGLQNFTGSGSDSGELDRRNQAAILQQAVKGLEAIGAANTTGFKELKAQSQEETLLANISSQFAAVSGGQQLEGNSIEEFQAQINDFVRSGSMSEYINGIEGATQDTKNAYANQISAIRQMVNEEAAVRADMGSGAGTSAEFQDRVQSQLKISDASLGDLSDQINKGLDPAIQGLLGLPDSLMSVFAGDADKVKQFAEAGRVTSEINERNQDKNAEALDNIKAGMKEAASALVNSGNVGLSAADKQMEAAVTMEKAANRLADIPDLEATSASGFIPNFSDKTSAVGRAIQTESAMGASKPVVDTHPSVGAYVRDAATQPNFAAVKRDHPEGIRKAAKNSAMIQGARARGFVPNFASFEEQYQRVLLGANDQIGKSLAALDPRLAPEEAIEDNFGIFGIGGGPHLSIFKKGITGFLLGENSPVLEEVALESAKNVQYKLPIFIASDLIAMSIQEMTGAAEERRASLPRADRTNLEAGFNQLDPKNFIENVYNKRGGKIGDPNNPDTITPALKSLATQDFLKGKFQVESPFYDGGEPSQGFRMYINDLFEPWSSDLPFFGETGLEVFGDKITDLPWYMDAAFAAMDAISIATTIAGIVGTPFTGGASLAAIGASNAAKAGLKSFSRKMLLQGAQTPIKGTALKTGLKGPDLLGRSPKQIAKYLKNNDKLAKKGITSGGILQKGKDVLGKAGSVAADYFITGGIGTVGNVAVKGGKGLVNTIKKYPNASTALLGTAGQFGSNYYEDIVKGDIKSGNLSAFTEELMSSSDGKQYRKELEDSMLAETSENAFRAIGGPGLQGLIQQGNERLQAEGAFADGATRAEDGGSFLPAGFSAMVGQLWNDGTMNMVSQQVGGPANPIGSISQALEKVKELNYPTNVFTFGDAATFLRQSGGKLGLELRPTAVGGRDSVNFDNWDTLVDLPNSDGVLQKTQNIKGAAALKKVFGENFETFLESSILQNPDLSKQQGFTKFAGLKEFASGLSDVRTSIISEDGKVKFPFSLKSKISEKGAFASNEPAAYSASEIEEFLATLGEDQAGIKASEAGIRDTVSASNNEETVKEGGAQALRLTSNQSKLNAELKSRAEGMLSVFPLLSQGNMTFTNKDNLIAQPRSVNDDGKSVKLYKPGKPGDASLIQDQSFKRVLESVIDIKSPLDPSDTVNLAKERLMSIVRSTGVAGSLPGILNNYFSPDIPLALSALNTEGFEQAKGANAQSLKDARVAEGSLINKVLPSPVIRTLSGAGAKLDAASASVGLGAYTDAIGSSLSNSVLGKAAGKLFTKFAQQRPPAGPDPRQDELSALNVPGDENLKNELANAEAIKGKEESKEERAGKVLRDLRYAALSGVTEEEARAGVGDLGAERTRIQEMVNNAKTNRLIYAQQINRLMPNGPLDIAQKIRKTKENKEAALRRFPGTDVSKYDEDIAAGEARLAFVQEKAALHEKESVASLADFIYQLRGPEGDSVLGGKKVTFPRGSDSSATQKFQQKVDDLYLDVEGSSAFSNIPDSIKEKLTAATLAGGGGAEFSPEGYLSATGFGDSPDPDAERLYAQIRQHGGNKNGPKTFGDNFIKAGTGGRISLLQQLGLQIPTQQEGGPAVKATLEEQIQQALKDAKKSKGQFGYFIESLAESTNEDARKAAFAAIQGESVDTARAGDAGAASGDSFIGGIWDYLGADTIDSLKERTVSGTDSVSGLKWNAQALENGEVVQLKSLLVNSLIKEIGERKPGSAPEGAEKMFELVNRAAQESDIENSILLSDPNFMAKRGDLMNKLANDAQAVENYEEWENWNTGFFSTKLNGVRTRPVNYGNIDWTTEEADKEGLALPDTIPGGNWLEALQATYGDQILRGQNTKIDKLLSGDSPSFYADAFGTQIKDENLQIVRDYFAKKRANSETPFASYAPLGYPQGEFGEFRPGGANNSSWFNELDPSSGDKAKIDQKAATGFVPNFSAVAAEMQASRDAGYQSAVTASQVKSMSIPGAGKTTYNTQEKVIKAKGMTQPFIVPPANSKAAAPYGSTVQKKFGFNPYAKSAEGFVPNLASTEDIAGAMQQIGESLQSFTDNLAQNNTQFGKAVSSLQQISSSLNLNQGPTSLEGLDTLDTGIGNLGGEIASLNSSLSGGISLDVPQSISELSQALGNVNVEVDVKVDDVNVNVQGAAGIQGAVQSAFNANLKDVISTEISSTKMEIANTIRQELGLPPKG